MPDSFSPVSSSLGPLIAYRRFLVTGATSGIGLAVTKALLDRGATVVAVGRRVEQLEPLLAVHRERLQPLRACLTDAGDVRFIVPQATAGGPLDGFVSAAGLAHHEPIGAISERTFREQFEVNTFAPMRLGEDLLTRLEPRAAMVFIASTLAHRPVATSYVYSATKAALLSAVKSLALAGAPRGIRVNALSPGVVDTPMIRTPRPGEEGDAAVAERMESLAALHPLGRLGTAHEVAEAALQLLVAPWTTGAELLIDGGLSLA
jgi:3-oxoacyl-[acyl-carrier protein] reductase